MNQITASFESAARAAHNAARDAFAATVMDRYWDDNDFAAAVNAVATYTAATAAGSKKLATIIAFRELFDGELGLVGAKRLADAVPQDLFD